MTTEEALALSQLTEDELAEVLDDAVHEEKSDEASRINNQGIDEQLAYLQECWGAENLQNYLRNLVQETADE
jgi:hypothetical protein